VRIDLGGSTCAEQAIVKENGHLRDGISGGKNECHDEVASSIVVGLAQRNLRPGEYNWLSQVLEHEAQRAGCITHGIRAHQNDKAVEVEIIGLYVICQESPIGGADVGGIQKWLISARTVSIMSGREVDVGCDANTAEIK